MATYRYSLGTTTYQFRDLTDLLWFLAVAEERSFTKAAAKLGTSEQVVKKVLAETKEKVNRERWLNLETTEQL